MNPLDVRNKLTNSISEAKKDTVDHIEKVRGFISKVSVDLIDRGRLHDKTKLESPEAEIFEEFTPKLKGLTYDSDEYRECLAAMKPATDHHYAENRHHPEHFPNSKENCCSVRECRHSLTDIDASKIVIDGKCPYCNQDADVAERYTLRNMNLVDIIEMICDWKAASMRHANGDIYKSIEDNQKRFGYTDEVKQLLINTVKYLEG